MRLICGPSYLLSTIELWYLGHDQKNPALSGVNSPHVGCAIFRAIGDGNMGSSLLDKGFRAG